VVAPGVRFNAFAIFVTPSFAFAIVFIWRFSPAVHLRRTLFLAVASFTLSGVGQAPSQQGLEAIVIGSVGPASYASQGTSVGIRAAHQLPGLALC
jgi:hypothetical protein